MQDLRLRLTDWLALLPVTLLIYLVHIPGFGYIRIDGLALLVILFSIYRHNGLPLIFTFTIGLIQDIVSLAPLGQHAIGLVVLAYVAQAVRDRVRIQSLPKQLPAVVVGLLLVKFIHSWVVALGFGQLPTLYSFLSVLVTGLCWIPLVLITESMTRKRPAKMGFG